MSGHLRCNDGLAEGPQRTPALDWVAESAAHWLRGGIEQLGVVETSSAIRAEGLRGQHAVIGDGGVYETDYHAFRERLPVSPAMTCRPSRPAPASSSA